MIILLFSYCSRKLLSLAPILQFMCDSEICFWLCNLAIPGTINSHSNESSRIWLDHSKSLPLSQFLCEWRLVSFLSLLLIFFSEHPDGEFHYTCFSNDWSCTLHFVLTCWLCYLTVSSCSLAVRSLVFTFRRDVQKLHPEVRQRTILTSGGCFCLYTPLIRNVYATFLQIVQHILLDMPSLAFFTTYALLVLFWAEIYYQVLVVSVSV